MSTARSTPTVTTTRLMRFGVESERQKSRTCLRRASAFSFTGILVGASDVHAKEVVEGVDQLRAHVGDEPELDVGLLQSDHRAVDVVADAVGEAVRGLHRF